MCRLHDWRRVWKNARFGSEVSGRVGSMKEVGSPVRRENQKRPGQDTVTSHAGQQRVKSGTAGQLAAWSSDLLGELSVGSLADPEGSKCSCWPGNLRRSISHSSCSWSPPRCCNLVPFRRLLGDLDWCSLFLEGLADSDSWPEGRTMSLSVTAADTDDELASGLSILQRSKNKKTFVEMFKHFDRGTNGIMSRLTIYGWFTCNIVLNVRLWQFYDNSQNKVNGK